MSSSIVLSYACYTDVCLRIAKGLAWASRIVAFMHFIIVFLWVFLYFYVIVFVYQLVSLDGLLIACWTVLFCYRGRMGERGVDRLFSFLSIFCVPASNYDIVCLCLP